MDISSRTALCEGGDAGQSHRRPAELPAQFPPQHRLTLEAARRVVCGGVASRPVCFPTPSLVAHEELFAAMPRSLNRLRLYGLPQNRPEFGEVSPAWVAEVDLVVQPRLLQ